MVDKWINVIRYGALVLLFLLIYMLVLRPIKRQIVTTFQELPRQLGMGKAPREALPGSAPGAPATKGDDTSSPGGFAPAVGGFSDAKPNKPSC